MKAIRLIRLNNIRVHAFHGAIPTENIVGSEINDIVREEMQKQRILIETVAESIVDRLFHTFTQVEEAEVSVAKLYPPMAGQVESAEVIVKKVRN